MKSRAEEEAAFSPWVTVIILVLVIVLLILKLTLD